ncbi:DNA adenine methylase [Levilactobacillus brevis]|uniref:DNA adenine methylase n=1 Tax=Levilactobacillus brevis TaxID=1580 RepID=UPI0021A7E4D3|nr:DNA adenine methylase [Levilactobacillus brevis]
MRKKKLSNFSNTPLRYPGGKGKITRFVGNIINQNNLHDTYVEPFAGGAGVAINLLLNGQVDNIIINDLDTSVFAFWKAVTEEPQKLINMIEDVPFDYTDHAERMTTEERYLYWQKVRSNLNFYRLSDGDHGIQEAFYFFVANRINVSGIVKGGPIGGKKQNGKYNISSRMNKQHLINRIIRISEHADQIIVKNLEATELIKLFSDGKLTSREHSLMFVDPPYYSQGRALYSSFMTDALHRMIAKELANSLNLNWILTYDTAPQIRELYADTNVVQELYKIQYSANKRGRFNEFLFHSPNIRVSSFENVDLMEI